MSNLKAKLTAQNVIKASLIPSGTINGKLSTSKITNVENNNPKMELDGTTLYIKNCVNAFTLTNITNIDFSFSPGLVEISDYAFADSTIDSPNIQVLRIPEGVKKIGRSAFSGWDKTERIILPSTLESIGINAFYNCDSVEEIAIPESVKVIGPGAFAYSDNLKVIRFKGKPTTMTNCLNGLSNIDVYVPWAEGEVVGAPWGATNANIHYI